MKEKVIVFEGANEVGKSTLAALLYTALRANEIPCELVSFPGNKVGTLGRHIYEVHHKPRHFGIEKIDSTSLQLLHIAAHIDAIEHLIKPAARAGRVIILDRFWWSTLIYGKVSGARLESLELMIEAERRHWNSFVPDAVFLINRTVPVGPLYDMDSWRNLSQSYVRLAKEEAAKYRVCQVDNNSSLDSAFGKIQSLLRLFDEPQK